MLSSPTNTPPLKVSYTDPTASMQISARLIRYFHQLRDGRRLAIVCLGTDRSTGDSLGPLAGTALSKFSSRHFDLYGTLAEPVHARNLDETLSRLHREIERPYIVGIDACLGKSASVGCILLGEGPIHPGAGVNKQLTPVGDVHLSAVVNVGGFMEYHVLQSTRLHVVVSMAELIAASLMDAVHGSLAR
ncbi:spore protease YyaC [Cohnella thailandensis]|uniref:Spore protease YyaC n=1 Tax=Cohnella thailandensis TaxID=557557 RepID=A0A841SYB1_9BACL|nr:spore protease YyaC [Cohnella thailandensis]MBB6637213.1 spore protease YyaC [Cohnella thailandensis]MBP1976965.1 putative sporulation protein YyaC [Cohnella thailandensis]